VTTVGASETGVAAGLAAWLPLLCTAWPHSVQKAAPSQSEAPQCTQYTCSPLGPDSQGATSAGRSVHTAAREAHPRAMEH